MHTHTMTDLERFLEQNTTVAKALAPTDLDPHFAEHHAGGLYVLIAPTGTEGHYVTFHDSWGHAEEEGVVVVHTYDPEDPEDDRVEEFTDPAAAYARFLQVAGA